MWFSFLVLTRCLAQGKEVIGKKEDGMNWGKNENNHNGTFGK